MVSGVDPVFVGLLIGLAAFFFFIYLLLRRTMTGFREGLDRGRED